MRLSATQRTVAAALMTPLNQRDRAARHPAISTASRLMMPNSQLSGRERLEIYCRSYWFRLLESFRDDFPGLAAILGPARFERLAKAYLVDFPSESFTLRNLGSRLEGWLSEHPERAGGNHRLALDMVRLEWAHIVAFDGPGLPALGTEDLNHCRPALRIGLQPYVTLLSLRYPVDDVRIRANANHEHPAAASNTATQVARARMEAQGRPDPQKLFVAVHRVDLSVYYRRLCREEYRLLCALRAGHTVAGAIGQAFDGSPVEGGDIAKLLTTWFRAWAEFGWLTAKSRRSRKP